MNDCLILLGMKTGLIHNFGSLEDGPASGKTPDMLQVTRELVVEVGVILLSAQCRQVSKFMAH